MNYIAVSQLTVGERTKEKEKPTVFRHRVRVLSPPRPRWQGLCPPPSPAGQVGSLGTRGPPHILGARSLLSLLSSGVEGSDFRGKSQRDSSVLTQQPHPHRAQLPASTSPEPPPPRLPPWDVGLGAAWLTATPTYRVGMEQGWRKGQRRGYP